jgi:DedD protein
VTNQFQNRLVGTIVLVALGVIFLPDLLDGKQSRVEEVFTEIPLRSAQYQKNNTAEVEHNPEVFAGDNEVASVELGAEPGKTQQKQLQLEGTSPPISSLTPIKMVETDTHTVKPQSAAQKPQAKPVVTAVKSAPIVKTPVPQNKPLPGVTLQLGGFNSAGNVVALVAQLRKAGFTTYTLPAKPVDGRLTKVFVGPEVSEDKLKSRQVQIEKLTGLKGKIVPYNPLEK